MKGELSDLRFFEYLAIRISCSYDNVCSDSLQEKYFHADVNSCVLFSVRYIKNAMEQILT